MRIERLARGVTLYQGDARELLPTLRFDAIIADPPYGIDYSAKRSKLPGAQQFSNIVGDSSEPDLAVMFSRQCPKIVFGANNFPSQLPHRGRWVCWDKRGGNENADRMLGSPFELAWTDKKSGYDKMIRLMHGGVVNADGWGIRRVHPTQKPVKLMERCISLLPSEAVIICDPYMGSGTTGVAAVRLGRSFVGIELDPKHFRTACRRISAALKERRTNGRKAA